MTIARIETREQLREVYQLPSERAQQKQLIGLDHHCRQFIELSPFVILASSGPNGTDATPRGGESGFVRAKDAQTLLLPDWPGNNRLDSLTNILENPVVGLLFFVPGVKKTLRVGGTAKIHTDEALLEPLRTGFKLSLTVLVIRVEKVYLHCAKAFMRSKLWDKSAQMDRSALPTASEMLRDHLNTAATAESPESQEAMEQRYKNNLY